MTAWLNGKSMKHSLFVWKTLLFHLQLKGYFPGLLSSKLVVKFFWHFEDTVLETSGFPVYVESQLSVSSSCFQGYGFPLVAFVIFFFVCLSEVWLYRFKRYLLHSYPAWDSQCFLSQRRHVIGQLWKHPGPSLFKYHLDTFLFAISSWNSN